MLQGVKMVTVACGWRHTISVSASGGLYTYGWSKYGQLGHGDFKDHLIPHKLEALHDNHISQVISYSHFLGNDFCLEVKFDILQLSEFGMIILRFKLFCNLHCLGNKLNNIDNSQ